MTIRVVCLAAVATVLAGCANPASKATPEPVVAAERAFAADGYEYGIKRSFLEHSADDALILSPDPVNAHEALASAPDGSPDDPKLVWWPLWAGISRSGDLGFTTGPFEFGGQPGGHYFTVWKKQADGQWKWVFDAGVGADPTAEDPKDSPVGYLPVAMKGAASPDAAMAEVKAAESELAAGTEENAVAAYMAWLAEDGRVHSQGPAPAKNASEHEKALTARAGAIRFSNLGGGASEAGDLVWTYGDARWSADGAEKRGHYVRMWQKRSEGWRIVFDELIPVRDPARAE